MMDRGHLQGINWDSTESLLLINPRMPLQDKEQIERYYNAFNHLKGHVWVTSSGSSGNLKLVALSKRALLISAKAVNTHLQCCQDDVWLNPLPFFHVGAIGIYGRASLSGSRVYEVGTERWDAFAFVEAVERASATLTALVPTQVYDIVMKQISSPSSLRAVIVGGGAMSDAIYRQAVLLGWKLLPSYGLTECASQVATAKLGSWSVDNMPLLYPLDHVEIAVDDDGFLQIKSEALMTGYIACYANTPTWTQAGTWYTTEDKAVLKQGAIQSLSRSTDFVKIGGESVDMLRLEKILEAVRLDLQFPHDCTVVAEEDARLGKVVFLVAVCQQVETCLPLVEEFRRRVLPFEQIRKVVTVDCIPRTPLNKVIRKAIAMTH